MPNLTNVAPGTFVNVPISITDFSSVLAVQFVIAWDPQILQFANVSAVNPNLPGLDAGDFNAAQALSQGIVRFVWATQSVSTGNSLPDGSTLFQLRFQVLGPLNSGCPLVFTQQAPTIFEVTQILGGQTFAFGINQVPITQGGVVVGNTVALSEPDSAADALALSAAPNPFSEKTQIFFSLQETTDIQLVVINPLGQVFWKKEIFQVPAGQHGMEIASTELGAKGNYYLILRTGKTTSVRSLCLF
jgi:hypothetical protein